MQLLQPYQMIFTGNARLCTNTRAAIMSHWNDTAVGELFLFFDICPSGGQEESVVIVPADA